MNRCLRCACLIALLAAPAVAADFPTRPVRMIVPWPAGGATDALSRIIGQRLTDVVGQQVIIDNRGGAAGAIGAGIAARATPDGHTIIILEGSHVIAPAMTAQLPYDVERDFAPLTLVGISPLVLFVHAGLPVKSVADFLAMARAKPGQVPVAHSSTGSLTHLVAELFQQRAGVKLNLVGYKGAAPAFIALASGEAHMYIVTLASGAPTLRLGRARVIAVAADKRLPALPGVPTLAEAGVPDMVVSQWWGYVAPIKVPGAVQARLHKALVAAIEHASVRERLTELAVDVSPGSPGELKTLLAAELKRWASVARSAGLSPQ